jgi:cyclopropane fatty-acyl-phospholipid synthase-like methyltransferase
MMALLADYPPLDPILDLGCGSGDLAFHLAQAGHQVMGVDFVPAAIASAQAKLGSLPPEVAARLEFRVADARNPAGLLPGVRSIVDSGFLHLLDPAEADLFVADLARALPAGGRYYLHEFDVEFDLENSPRQITEAEIRERFAENNGWRVVELRPANFLSNVAPPVDAVVAMAERLG